MDGVGTQGAMNYAAVPDIPVNFAVNRFGKFLSRHVSGQVIRSVFAETIFFGWTFGAPFYSEVMRESSADPTYLSRTAVRGKGIYRTGNARRISRSSVARVLAGDAARVPVIKDDETGSLLQGELKRGRDTARNARGTCVTI